MAILCIVLRSVHCGGALDQICTDGELSKDLKPRDTIELKCSFYMYSLCNISSQKPKICSWIPLYWSQDSPDSRQAKLALFDLLFFSESGKNHISRNSCWPFLKLVLMLEIFSFYWHFPSFEKRSPRFLSVFSHLLFKGKKQISSQLPRVLCVEGNFGECRKLSVFS